MKQTAQLDAKLLSGIKKDPIASVSLNAGVKGNLSPSLNEKLVKAKVEEVKQAAKEPAKTVLGALGTKDLLKKAEIKAESIVQGNNVKPILA